MAKEFIDQLNDLIAPVTHAWVEAEIMTVAVNPDAGHAAGSNDELIVDVRLCLKKQKAL